MTLDRAERIKLNDLTLAEKMDLAKVIYSKESYFQQLFSTDRVEFDCLEISAAFRNEIMRILIEKEIIPTVIPLEVLHEYISADMRAYNFDDGVNKITTLFYQTDASFMKVYHLFIRFLRENFINEPFWFQKTPTLRIHCPDAENSHHYPRYHTDIGYGHPAEEINIWFPLTEVLTGHGFRMMDVEQSKMILKRFDYDFSAFIASAIEDKQFSAECESTAEPVDTAFGKIRAFDSRCIHSGEPLKNHTRISMDIRILPLSQYEKMSIEYQGSGRRKVLFAPGHCYHEQTSDYFMQSKEGEE